MKRWLVLAGAVALLSACGSSVKLDNVPVEDKTGTTVVTNDTSKSASSQAARSSVTTVDVGKNANDGAATAGRVVYFDYDSFVIRPEFYPAIDAHAKRLLADKGRKAMIEGHTDDRGGREYNLALGQKRAEAVRQRLVLLGVADVQLEAVSFGKEKPAVVGSSEAAMEKNRRAEIVYR